jgi:hypothetical protein
MRDDPTLGEIRRRLAWVGFLEPLPEAELDDLTRRADFLRLGEGEVLVVGSEARATTLRLVPRST